MPLVLYVFVMVKVEALVSLDRFAYYIGTRWYSRVLFAQR